MSIALLVGSVFTVGLAFGAAIHAGQADDDDSTLASLLLLIATILLAFLSGQHS